MKNRMIKVGNVVPSLKVANISYNTEQIKQAILDHQDVLFYFFLSYASVAIHVRIYLHMMHY